MKQFIATALLLARLCQSEAQSELDTIVVTNSYSKESIESTGRNIIVIKGEQFQKQPSHSIDELLRYLPGVEVQTRGIEGTQSDIVLRGGTFQQVLVILDNVRLNDPNSGHFTSYIPIAPEEIDRIEILKGASSSIYGSEAVGGVIHIITKTFAPLAALKGGTGSSQAPGMTKEINGQVSVGEHGLITSNLGGSYGDGKNFVSVGLLTAKADGEQERGIKGYFDNKTASLSLSHLFGNSIELSVRSSYDDRNFAAQNFYTSFLSDTSSERVKTFWNQIRIGYEKNRSRLSLDAGYKNLNDHFLFTPHSVANYNRSFLLQALAVYELKANDDDRIVTGVQFINKKIVSNDRGHHAVNEIGEFISYSKHWNAFFINPSIRLNEVQDQKTELVPQLNLSYRLRKFQLRASGGKTIRNADFTERFNNYNKTIVTGGRIGNPDLEAETSWSYEAGADYFINGQLKVSSSVFQRYHHDLIDYVPTAYADMPRKDNLIPTGSYALAKNISKVTTSGAELDLQYSKQYENARNLFATLGIVWLHSESSSAVPSFYVSSHAKLLVNFNLQYTLQRFSLSLNGVYKNRNPQGAAGMKSIPANCMMINGKIDFRIVSYLSAFTETDNVFDEKCSDLLGAQLPGRWSSAGVRLQFSNSKTKNK